MLFIVLFSLTIQHVYSEYLTSSSLNIFICQMKSIVYAPVSNKTYISSPVTLFINPATQPVVLYSFTITDDYGGIDYVFSNTAYSNTKPIQISLSNKSNSFYMLFASFPSNLTLGITFTPVDLTTSSVFAAPYPLYFKVYSGVLDSNSTCGEYTPSATNYSSFTNTIIIVIVIPLVFLFLLVIPVAIYRRCYCLPESSLDPSFTNSNAVP